MDDEQTRVRFERLVLPLMTEAYNLARWRVKNENDARDAVQDFYLKSFRFSRSSTGRKMAAPSCSGSFATRVTPLGARNVREKGAADHKEVAALVYRHDKHLINLFVWLSPPDHNALVQSLTEKGYNVIHWEQGGFSFWAISDFSMQDLQTLADLEMQSS